jgi:hypothetical protein
MTNVGRFLNEYFYRFISQLIALVVVYEFSHTVDTDLIHASARSFFKEIESSTT